MGDTDHALVRIIGQRDETCICLTYIQIVCAAAEIRGVNPHRCERCVYLCAIYVSARLRHLLPLTRSDKSHSHGMTHRSGSPNTPGWPPSSSFLITRQANMSSLRWQQRLTTADSVYKSTRSFQQGQSGSAKNTARSEGPGERAGAEEDARPRGTTTGSFHSLNSPRRAKYAIRWILMV